MRELAPSSSVPSPPTRPARVGFGALGTLPSQKELFSLADLQRPAGPASSQSALSSPSAPSSWLPKELWKRRAQLFPQRLARVRGLCPAVAARAPTGAGPGPSRPRVPRPGCPLLRRWGRDRKIPTSHQLPLNCGQRKLSSYAPVPDPASEKPWALSPRSRARSHRRSGCGLPSGK